MSGAFSVLFGFLGFFDVASSRKLFVFLAFAALLITVGRLTYKCLLAEDMVKPKLKVSYSGDDPGCMVDARYQNGVTSIIARLRVESSSQTNISDCKAVITCIEKDGIKVVDGLNLLVFFSIASASDARSKAVNFGIPEFLDVFEFLQDGSAAISARFPFAYEQWKKLDPLSNYAVTFGLTANNTIPTIAVAYLRHQEGKWEISLTPPSTAHGEAKPPHSSRFLKQVTRD